MLSRALSPFLPQFTPPTIPNLHGNIRDIGRDEEGFEVVIGSGKKCQTDPTIPSSGTPAPSTTEDPTTTSLVAEDKSLNMSEVKPSAGVKPRLTPAQWRALGVEKEKEVARGGGGTMRLGSNVEEEVFRLMIGWVYAVLLHPDERGQYDVAEEILRHLMVSNVSNTRPSKFNSYRVDHVLAEQPNFVVEQARKLITTASIQQRASQDSSRNRRERA
ncbi:hypothetical protein BJ165DRAFT_1533943 [Panaeolus papilionaceus]|nr:hypothetical protein BJ165DRAFT_1533943 [Panaeolus papilionaceus]